LFVKKGGTVYARGVVPPHGGAPTKETTRNVLDIQPGHSNLAMGKKNTSPKAGASQAAEYLAYKARIVRNGRMTGTPWDKNDGGVTHPCFGEIFGKSLGTYLRKFRKKRGT